MKKILSITLCLMFISMPVYAQWSADEPVGSTRYVHEIDDYLDKNQTAVQRLLKKFKEGCRLVYSSGSTLTVELGEVMLTDATDYVMPSNTSDTSATFSNIDTGAEAGSTTYYVYAGASSTSDTTFTVYFSVDSSTPTGVTYYRRLGSFYNNSDSDISRIENDNVYSDLGEWESKSADVAYTAETNGFMVAYCANGTAGQNNHIGFTVDGTNRVVCNSETGNGDINHSGAAVPVAQGSVWQAVKTGDPNTYVFWIQIN